jgi:hypothetical protein
MIDEKKPDAPEPRIDNSKAKFPDTQPARPQLGKVKTDEEARLAAEIEKLRG